MIRILCLLTTASVFAQPKDAFIVERAPIPASVHANRELVLWMLNPAKHDRGPLDDLVYNCPDRTLGSYYSGQTRLSLVDASTGREMNRVKLSYHHRGDTSDIPYRILGGQYMFYSVPNGSEKMEGPPKLLDLRDFNGDGLALETAFYEAEACMGLQTTLIGYSVKQDRVIQYQVDVTQKGGKPVTQAWTDYLFSEQPKSPGHWEYMIDYSGRGGCQDTWRAHYDASREKFFATLSQAHCIEIK